MFDFAELFERSPNPYTVLDRQFRYVAMNQAYLQVTGRTRDQLLGMCLFDAFPVNPSDHEATQTRQLLESFQRVFATAETDTIGLIRYSIPTVGPDGRTVFEERFWSATHTPIAGPEGPATYLLQHTVDVTELQRLKDELQQVQRTRQPRAQLESGLLERARLVQETNRLLDSERQRLLRMFDEAPGFMAFLRGPDHVFELANRAYLKLVQRERVVGARVCDVLPEVAEQGYIQLLDEVYRSGRAFIGSGLRVEIETGSGRRDTIYVDLVYQPVRDAAGEVIGIFTQGHDITPQMEAQAQLQTYRDHLEDLVLERTRALEQSEAALRQASKMEAIGRLTGGVAHDFNNVLQVIGANLQLLSLTSQAAPGPYLAAALNGVERGSKLASQLLAFARQQPLQPVVLDLQAHLARLEDMLARTLGEAVELHIEISEPLSCVEVDPHQLDNALLNLAINARDAMGEGGLLRIQARDVFVDDMQTLDDRLAPGEYVLLRVLDNGCGMSEEVLRQACDPFFTTKPTGQGTGLGLSMVYGFVKQTGGQVVIDSRVGAGTRVDLYLPRSLREASAAAEVPAVPIPRGNETVLVVEDDPAVRGSAVELLRTLGYHVLEAADGASALALIDAGARPDVLFTDVVMPGPIPSVELARLACERLPRLAVLYTSGYPRQAIQEGRLDADIHLLGKPYRREELASRLREAIDRAHARPGTGAASSAGLRVLVVEDEPDTRLLTLRLLEVLGHRAEGTGHARAALEVLESGTWDVLMTDMRLPDLTGLDLARQARTRCPGLRIVLATGFAPDDVAREPSVNAVLSKPYTPEQLMAALDAFAR